MANSGNKKTTKPAEKKATARPATKKSTVSPKSKPSAASKTAVDKLEKTAQAMANMRSTLKKTLGKAGSAAKSKLSAEDRKALTTALQELRARVADEISFLTGDNLNRSNRETAGDLSSYSLHLADHGTDNFDREFALNLASSEQDVIYEIDEALARLRDGNYGVCEGCAQAIERARLEALPFARMCVKCKSASERGKTKFRPFGPTIGGF